MTKQAPERPLRVCYFGTYREQYGRNVIMRAGLHAQGAEVEECHVTLWRGISDRVEQASGGWRRPRFWLRVLSTYLKLIRAHWRTPPYDVMLVGYPGQFDVYLGRLLSWWRRKPLVLDVYMSLYLIAEERGLVARSPWSGRLIRALETGGMRLTDRLIADTVEYVAYYCRTYHLNPEQFSLVPAGADDRLFYPRPEVEPPADAFRILYYGTFIPNHDAPLIVKAAALLRDRPEIEFHFYGEGPEEARCREIAEEQKLSNVHFHGWVARERLPQHLAAAHVCLGAFGQTPQSCMTIQNKIWEALAMARPLISGDSPTARAAFRQGEEIYLVERGNPQALAEAIVALWADPAWCTRLADNGYRRFQSGNTIAHLGEQTREVLLETIARRQIR